MAGVIFSQRSCFYDSAFQFRHFLAISRRLSHLIVSSACSASAGASSPSDAEKRGVRHCLRVFYLLLHRGLTNGLYGYAACLFSFACPWSTQQPPDGLRKSFRDVDVRFVRFRHSNYSVHVAILPLFLLVLLRSTLASQLLRTTRVLQTVTQPQPPPFFLSHPRKWGSIDRKNSSCART